ncbi:MAG: type II secretion system F family protein [Planctomycetia bacterium]|nr:type II secretion system F family protein [Planctomycetia bacterium]
MPKYHYTTVDAHGRRAVGHVEATGPDDALRQLADLGLNTDGADLAREDESPESPSPKSEPAAGRDRLNLVQSVEVVDEISRLAGAELPLGPGLRALAAELGHGRVARAVRRIAAALDAGATIEDALDAEGTRFPPHVRGLILAGARSGRLGEVLEDFVDLERHRIELRRRIRLILAYPALLMAIMVALCVLLGLFVIPPFESIFRDFDTDLPPITQFVLWLFGTPMWYLLGGHLLLFASLYTLWALPGPVWVKQLCNMAPVVGPLRRWSRLVRFSRLMAILLREEIPLPAALRLTATAMHDANLALGCRRAASDVEAGRPLSESLAVQWQFPDSMIPMIAWGQRNGTLAEAFRAVGEMFEGRAQVQTGMLDILILPFTLMLFVLLAGLIVTALFMPLISLIQNLTK